jgi:serine/threonine protein kinase
VAPEVIQGGQQSAAADVYSLCALGYTFACGRRPFAKRLPWVILELLRHDWAAHDEHLQAVADRRLREVLTAGLSRDPARRPRDGAALLQALEGS